MTLTEQHNDDLLLPPVRRTNTDAATKQPAPLNSAPHRSAVNRWRVARRVSLAIVVLIVVAMAWVGIRAALAGQAIAKGVESATELGVMLGEGDISRAEPLVNGVRASAAEAHALTSDPVWRAFEFVPVLGGNLSTARESVAALDGVARNALPDLVQLASSDTQQAIFHAPRVDRIVAMAGVSPAIANVSRGLSSASTRLDRVDASSNVAALTAVFTELSRALSTYAGVGESLDGISRVALALSAPDSEAAQMPWTMVVADEASRTPIALVDFSTSGGSLVIGGVRSGDGEVVANDHVFDVDAASLAFLLDRVGDVRVDSVGTMSADSIEEFIGSDASSVTPDAAAGQLAIGQAAAAVLSRLFG